jgi:Co/Zn/Cd efflux system component
MGETKETKQEASLIPLLAAAYLLFFCLECVLAVEVRSVAFFSDSIVFLEGASVSVPTCFMFWMIAANYYGAEVPSAAPMATIGAVLLLTNIACLMMLRRGMSVHPADSSSNVRSHAIMNAAIILAAFLTWGSGTMWLDVLVGLGILYMNEDAAAHVELAARPPPARAA